MISKSYYQSMLSKDANKPDRSIVESDLFNYIVESEVLGQCGQVRELVGRLGKKQYRKFILYLQDNEIYIKGCYLK